MVLFQDGCYPDEEILQGESGGENWIPKRWRAWHQEAPLVPGEKKKFPSLDTFHNTDTHYRNELLEAYCDDIQYFTELFRFYPYLAAQGLACLLIGDTQVTRCHDSDTLYWPNLSPWLKQISDDNTEREAVNLKP